MDSYEEAFEIRGKLTFVEGLAEEKSVEEFSFPYNRLRHKRTVSD